MSFKLNSVKKMINGLGMYNYHDVANAVYIYMYSTSNILNNDNWNNYTLHLFYFS